MNFVRRSPEKFFFGLFARYYSFKRRNHYDVLNLQKNCSAKDIKEAFIKMSKEYHPDKNKDVNAQDKFIRILEAYNVLSKPSSRSQYDNMSDISRNAAAYAYRPHTPYNRRHANAQAHYSYSYAQYNPGGGGGGSWQQRQQAPLNKKIPNLVIILTCVGFAVFGFLVQITIIKKTFIMNQRRAEDKSRLIGEELERVRSAAAANGNELQTRLLLDKIAGGAHPAAATAALGAALAADHKSASTDSMLAQLAAPETARALAPAPTPAPAPAPAPAPTMDFEFKETDETPP